MDINSLFPSRFLKATDLQNQSVTATIENASLEQFNDGKKLVLTLKDKDKAVVLNKTNTLALAAAFGSESNDWPGQRIQITSEFVTYRGQSTRGLKIRPLTPGPSAKPGSGVPPLGGADDEMEGDVPW